MGVLLLAMLLSAPDPEMMRQAEIRAAKAIAFYEAKAFARAAQYFLEAYELSGEPTQLRNAAKALESAGAIEQAKGAWNQLLERSDLTAGMRGEAEERLAALDAVESPVEAPIVEPPKVEPPRVEPPRVEPIVETPIEPAGPTWEPWVVTAAGALSAGAGGVLYWLSSRDLRRLEDRLAMKDAEGRIVGIPFDDALRERDRINGLRIGGVVALSVGIGAALAGLAWWWFE
jgi:hypothetical protein